MNPLAASAKVDLTAVLSEADIDAFISVVDDARVDADAAATSGAMATYDSVHELLCVPLGRPFSHLRALLGALVSRSVLNPEMEPYRDLLRVLQYGTSSDKRFRDFSDRAAWIAAIRILVRMNDGTSSRLGLIGFERELAVGEAVKRLMARGYRLRGDGIRFRFEADELERCCESLNKQCGVIGGMRLVWGLLTHLQQAGAFRDGRYFIGRRQRSPTGGDASPSVPLGFLMNTAFRHLHSTPSEAPSPEQSQELIDLAVDIAAAVDVESYSVYANFYQTAESLPLYLGNLVLADHILTFPQIVPRDALELMRGVFAWVDDQRMTRDLGWSVADALLVAERLLLGGAPNAANIIIEHEQLLSLGPRPSAVESMLSFICHDPTEVNKNYLTPYDARQADAFSKPLVRLSGMRYLMVSPPICALAFYESIATALRGVFSDSDKLIGDAIEPTVARAFESRKIVPSATSKDYGAKRKKEGDCDSLIEADPGIVLVELKKKSLTKRAQAGGVLKLFLDIYGGFLRAQEQLGRQEIALRRHGELRFLDGSLVELRGRRIERVAVTLLDWGATQDSTVWRLLAHLLVDAQINGVPETEEDTEDLEKCNKALKKLAEQSRCLESLGVDARDQFSRWWFLSVPQLLFVLNNSKDANDFYTRLRWVKSMTTGSLDFYTEYSYRKNLEAAVRAGPKADAT